MKIFVSLIVGAVVASKAALSPEQGSHQTSPGGNLLRQRHAASNPSMMRLAAAPTPDMKTEQHQKEAGNGYLPGSPLYEEQEKLKRPKTPAAVIGPLPGTLGAGGPNITHPAASLKTPSELSPEETYEVWKFNTGVITANVATFLLFTALQFLVVMCCAFVYIKNKVDPLQPPRDGLEHHPSALDRPDFRFGLFDCMHAPPICFWAFCCPTIRWSDTMRMAGLMSFWVAVIGMTLLSTFGVIAQGLTLLIYACIGAYHRQQIRRLFGMPAGDFKTGAEDFCAYCCCCLCGCCAIVQEARQLEEAYAVNHRVVKVVAAPRQQLR